MAKMTADSAAFFRSSRAYGAALAGLFSGLLACAPSAFDHAGGAATSASDASVTASQPGADAAQQAHTPDAASTASMEPQSSAPSSVVDAAARGPVDAASGGTTLPGTGSEAMSPGAASDAATPSASSDAASARDAGEPQAPCDAANDPLNCGSCGHVCSVPPAASASCSLGRCAHQCSAGAADCDGDLEAPLSNGCEVSLYDSSLHCGACDLRCDAPTGGVAACEKRACVGYVPHVGAPTAQTNVAHGSDKGGGAVDLLCGVDEVLTGFDTAFDNDRIYGLSALCARISTTGTAASPKLVLGSPHASPMAGALNLAWTPPHLSFPCPTGKVVSSLEGTLWYYDDAARTADNLSIKQLILTCSELTLDNAHNFSTRQPVQQSVGNNVGAVEQRFSDQCSPGSVVVGFKLRAGAWIDQVWTQSGALRVDRAATSSHVKQASEL